MNQSSKAKNTFQFYWRHVRKYPRYVIGVLLSVPVSMLVNVFIPSLILANVLSRLAKHGFTDEQIWASFGPQLAIYAGSLLFGVAVWRVIDWFAWRLEAHIQQDIAEEVFARMIDKSADFHANNFSGALVSHNNKLLGSYIRMADATIFQVLPMLSSLVIACIIMAGRAPIFVVALIVLSTGFITIAFLSARPARKAGAAHALLESRQTGFLADAIGNVMVIKSFARGRYERKRFSRATSKTMAALLTLARKQQVHMNYLGTSSRIFSITALLLAVISVMVFRANIGTVFLIFSISEGLGNDLFQFSNNTLRNFNRSIGDAHEMIAILAEKPSVTDLEQPEPLRIKNGDISFRNVVFQHDGSDDAIFNGLNLDIKHGEKIGLVGHSGSGKTTFTRLLLRFSDIDDGEILIDGQNIASITQDNLHSVVAYVPQEPLLFHRSIAENIAYGNPDASQEQIEQVARQAHAHEFVSALPKAYDTLVGERGVKLSGGQRQRVAIARAMLKNAPILVLDEATSALDSESEVLIQDALWKLMEGRTAIVIAHRLSTIQHMNHIVVLDDGKIVEAGNHQELISTGGTYAKLWAHQSGGFIDE